MENFALIFVAMLIGYIINRQDIFPKDTPIILNQFILYVSLPALVLLKIPQLTFSFEIIIPVITAWIVMIISAVVVLFLCKIMNFSKEVTGSLLLVGVLGNTSFLGIPVIQAYFGESALPYVVIYDQLGSFIALSTYGTFIAAYYSSEKSVDVKVIAKKILIFPPFLFLLISMFFIGRTFHPVVISVLDSLASTIVPLALVAVGLQLRFKLPSQDVKPFITALSVKLILSPLIAIGVVMTFSWQGEVALVSIMEAGMGPMITAGAVASMAGLAPRLSSAIVGYGILIAFFTTWILHSYII